VIERAISAEGTTVDVPDFVLSAKLASLDGKNTLAMAAFVIVPSVLELSRPVITNFIVPPKFTLNCDVLVP